MTCSALVKQRCLYKYCRLLNRSIYRVHKLNAPSDYVSSKRQYHRKTSCRICNIGAGTPCARPVGPEWKFPAQKKEQAYQLNKDRKSAYCAHSSRAFTAPLCFNTQFNHRIRGTRVLIIPQRSFSSFRSQNIFWTRLSGKTLLVLHHKWMRLIPFEFDLYNESIFLYSFLSQKPRRNASKCSACRDNLWHS